MVLMERETETIKIAEDEYEVLRSQVVSLFGKYYRNIHQMTKEQREHFRPQLSALLMEANQKLQSYVQLEVVVRSHANLNDVNSLIEKHPTMSADIKKFVKTEDFDGLDDFLAQLQGEANLLRIEREINTD